MSTIEAIKKGWGAVYSHKASFGRKEWIANQIIAELKNIGEVEEANKVVMMTNDEVAEWLEVA